MIKGKNNKAKTDDQGEKKNIDKNNPSRPWKSPAVEPGNDRPDHSANKYRNKQDENHLVKAIEKPECKSDQNKHKRCPYNPPEGPIIWWCFYHLDSLLPQMGKSSFVHSNRCPY